MGTCQHLKGTGPKDGGRKRWCKEHCPAGGTTWFLYHHGSKKNDLPKKKSGTKKGKSVLQLSTLKINEGSSRAGPHHDMTCPLPALICGQGTHEWVEGEWVARGVGVAPFLGGWPL